ncbi:tyrosine-type recombinase/integrase [Patescibacteria group bacterium]
MKKHILQFLEYLETKKKRCDKGVLQYAPTTSKNYDFYLSRFFKWANNNGISDIKKITANDIEKYKNWLNKFKDNNKKCLKKNTQNYHLIALRSFLKYLNRANFKILDPIKIKLYKMPEQNIVSIKNSELERLLNAPLLTTPPPNPLLRKEGDARPAESSENNKIIMLRDKAILETLFSTGLRVSELSNLKTKQIQNNSNKLLIKNNDKSKTVYLSNQAKYWIKKYLDIRTDKSKYLFVSHDKAKNKRDSKGVSQYAPTKYAPLTCRSIQRIVKKYAKLAGITKKISPHSFRNSL